MIKLDPSSKKPIYIQIVQGFKTLILNAKMHTHQQLPSVRKLAKELSINPNTVQKAYAILEEQGIIYSVAGKGGYVADNAAAFKAANRQRIVELFLEATLEARNSGMWIDEIFTLVDDIYSNTFHGH